MVMSLKISQQKNSGFTLMELLVVIVIIGLLVAYIAPRYFGQLNNSEQQTTKAQIESLARALDSYRVDLGHYPAQSIGLEALNQNIENSDKWKGPYLQKEVPKDPWGGQYQYQLDNNNDQFQLLSFGKDGQLGGEDVNSDIRYR